MEQEANKLNDYMFHLYFRILLILITCYKCRQCFILVSGLLKVTLEMHVLPNLNINYPNKTMP